MNVFVCICVCMYLCVCVCLCIACRAAVSAATRGHIKCLAPLLPLLEYEDKRAVLVAACSAGHTHATELVR